MIQQLNIRFGKQAISVVRALSLIPRHIDQTQDDTVNEVFNYYKDDLPSPESFRQELRIWKAFWNNKPDKPDNITLTITDPRTCSTIVPNHYLRGYYYAVSVVHIVVCMLISVSNICCLIEVYSSTKVKHRSK
jgi:hypothetical protein